MTKTFSFLFILASLIPTVSAGEFGEMSLPLPLLVSHLKKGQEGVVPTPVIDTQLGTLNSTIIQWPLKFHPNNIKLGLVFEYKKNRYSIHAGFTRGAYDAFTKTYLTNPIISIWDITSIDDPSKMAHTDLIELTKPYDTIFTDSQGNKLRITFNPETKIITVFFPGTFGEKKISSAQYDQLFNLWEENVKDYKRVIFGKTFYFIPQICLPLIGTPELRLGFVASEESPFYYTTNRPLDFISLFHKTPLSFGFKPIAYSIPLGLKFKFLGNDSWQIEEMVNEDLNDALDDEALDTPAARR